MLGTADGRLVAVDERASVLGDQRVADGPVRDAVIVGDRAVIAVGEDVLGLPAPSALVRACA